MLNSQMMQSKLQNFETMFLDELTNTLGTMLASPEEYITLQGYKSDSMYFIIHGSCKIQIQSVRKLEPITLKKKLGRSDHFGEVGCLFDC